MYPESRETDLGASTGLLRVMSPRSPSQLRLSAPGLFPRDSPDTSRTLSAPHVRLTRDHPRSQSVPPPGVPFCFPGENSRTPYAYTETKKGRGEGEGMRDRGRGRDMPEERNKKKNHGLVRSRRVASRRRFLGRERARGVRRGCANRCVGPFPLAGTEELREAIPFPTEGTFEWCARLFAVLVEMVWSCPASPVEAGIRPRRSIRLEHGTPANG